MYCPRLGRDRQHQAWWGREAVVSRHNDFNFIKFKVGRTCLCTMLISGVYIWNWYFMQKYLHCACGGGRRGTHRCVLDNFDSGPHCRAEQSRAERQVRRGNSCRWQQQQHHILIPVPNPVARLSRGRFVALFISLLRELCFCCCFSFCCCCFSFCCWCRVVSRLACFVSC